MKLKDLNEKYGEYEVKEGFMDLLIKPRSKTVLDLKEGDEYSYVYGDGCPAFGTWCGTIYECNARNLGNVFLTEEEVKFELERRMIHNEFLHAGGRLNFREKKNNYCICRSNNEINIMNLHYNNFSTIYFDTEEQAIKAIKAIGEDRLKKYWFVHEE